MYKWECDRSKTTRNRSVKIKKPKQFKMNINYRSHNGILELASSVIDLISDFFPDSIDKLPREHSEVGGPRPIIFDGIEAETFLNAFSSDNGTESYIELGAEQVIIVRDEKTKKSVMEKVGNEFG